MTCAATSTAGPCGRVRNQGGTSNCWAFATTALYEAMVRIEHCLWSSRSEGDMVTIEHWWRFNAAPGSWNRSAVFGSGVRRVIGLIQSTFGTNLEIIVENQTGTYQHYWRDGAGWHAGVTI